MENTKEKQSLSKEENDISKKISEKINKKINDHLNKCICNILVNNEIVGIGFFFKIVNPSYKEKNIYSFSISSENLKKEEICNEKKIKISFNDGTIKYLDFSKNRMISVNKYNTNIAMQIFPDEDDINNFLDLDDIEIFKEGKLIENIDAYTFEHDKSDKLIVSFLPANEVNNKDIKIKCQSKPKDIGSPIISFESFKVIGILVDNNKTILKKEISQLNQNNDIKSEISLKLLVNEYNIDEDIYIINSPEYLHKNEIIKGRELNEINEDNIIMYINGVKTKFEKYKKFSQIGEYSKNLKFKNNLTKFFDLFFGCIYITEINFINFNIENEANISNMFFGCESLVKIDLSSL